jgi:uncharacterized membrane protein YoaK (UPF0700 family)
MKKLLIVVACGAVMSFILTIAGETLVSSLSLSGWQRYVWLFKPEFPLIALIVGVLIGLVMKERASLAAALSLVPWSIFLIVGTNLKHFVLSRYIITTTLVSVYFLLGVGAAAFAGGRTTRSVTRADHLRS